MNVQARSNMSIGEKLLNFTIWIIVALAVLGLGAVTFAGAQQTIAPSFTSQLNTNLYVKMGQGNPYQTIAQATTKACTAPTAFTVILLPGANPADTISGQSGVCNGATAIDYTAAPAVTYKGSGGVYVAQGSGGGGPPTGAAGGDLNGSNYPNPQVTGLKGVPFCAGFTPTNGQAVVYTTGGSPNPCYAASGVGGSTTLTGDVTGTGTGTIATNVGKIGGVALCAGLTPTNGQVLQYTTSSSPNPCYTAATPGSGFTAAGDLSGSSSSQTVTGLQGKPVAATAPATGQTPTWNGAAYIPATPAIAFQPSPTTLIADYDFHDGSGTTVTDVSGNGNNMTLTSGTPGGTTAPRWIQNPATNAGVGVAMGSDNLGSYGLPVAQGGTSCETIPVLQNAARTVLIQYFLPPAGTDGTQNGIVQYTNTYAIQDWLGSSNGSIGYDFNSTSFVSPWIAANTGGSLFLSSDNMVGFHTDIIVLAAGVPVTYYHDGQAVPAWSQRNIPSLVATNWVLGCNGVNQVNGGVDIPTAPSLVFRLSFWSNALNAIEAQQAYGYVTNNLLVTKGFQPQILPPQVGTNQYIAVGDSQVEGTDGLGSGSLFPYVDCALTNTCYGTTYNSSLLGFGGRGWTVGAYGMPGAGPDSFASQVGGGLGKLRGDSNFLHIADILGGTNGLTQPPPPPCPTIQNLKHAGFDVWVETLFSLNPNPAIDRANPNRDSYNFSEMQSAPLCGATGVIDISSDAFIGGDGTNGGTPPGGVGVVGAHLSPSGQAYKMQLNARVLNAYYQANPNVQTVYSAASVTLNGWDRYTTFNTAGNAIAATLPDCIGMVNMPYFFIVSGTNTATLTPATVAGQTELMSGSGVLAANSVYKYVATTRATQFLAPGGCIWVPVQAPGATPGIATIGSTVTVDGAHFFRSNNGLFGGQFSDDISFGSCANATFKTFDGAGLAADGTYVYRCAYGGGAELDHSDATHDFMDVPLIPKVYTCSTLPAAATAGAGAMVQVSDATTFTPGACVGGGTDYMLAVSDGSTWRVH